MTIKKDKLERKVQAICCGLLVTLVCLGALVPSIRAERSGWSIETVDSTGGNTGFYTSLALDSSGYPHISYYYYDNTTLRYAYQDGGGWHISTVDSAGDVGWFTSLALDTSGYPHISYLDGTNGDLKYAYQDGSGWHTVTVDSTGNVGPYTSLALDSSDYPHISYLDATNRDLKYAYKDSAGWHNITVDSIGLVGWYTSLALDTSGYPRISYLDYTNEDLKYAYKDGSGWHTVTVDSTGGMYTSLALDSSGYPHISYYVNGDLKYAYKDSAGWHTSTVDSAGDVGWYTSLALDTSGYPHISYYGNGDLKYAWIEPPTVDYIHITFADGTEISNQSLATKFSLECYAAAFNTTYGHLGFIECSWNRVNSGGSNASLNATTGSSVKLYTGWYEGTVTLTIDDGDGHSDSVVFTVNASVFSMMMHVGWNLVTIPITHGWTAETLGENITGCSVVIMFNASTQMFLTHVVGVPHDDFPILDGVGYFVFCTRDSVFSVPDASIGSVSVPICEEWNIVGWYHEYSTMAESLGDNISGTSVVIMFDPVAQVFLTHVVGIPHDNFIIERGMGVFVYTTTTSIWHGEG